MKNKILGVFLVAAVIVIIVSMTIKHLQAINKIGSQKQEYEQITNELAKSKVEIITQKEIIEKINSDWKKEKLGLEYKITQLSDTKFSFKNYSNISKQPDLEIYHDNNRRYVVHELHFSDGEKKGPPIGYVMIYDDGHVVSKIYKHHISVNQVQSVNPKTGKYSILNKADFVLEQAGLANRKDSTKDDWTNKPYPLNVLDGSVDISNEPAKPKFNFFDPKLSLSSSVSNLGLGLGGSLSMSSYDRFRFLRFGVEKIINNTKKYDFFMAPFEYNIGGIFNNTYVYPLININDNSKLGGGLGLSVNF